MLQLIPRFIQERYLSGERNGQFSACTLFMDVVQFTAMTEALMQHGKEGAEEVATIINRIFEPVIHAIYDHGGFITDFAGDAFTAVFEGDSEQSAVNAVATAVAIQKIAIAQKSQTTPYGTFPLAVKQGLSVGAVEWGVVGTDTHLGYYFRGAAMDGCVEAQEQAHANGIIVDDALQALLADKATFAAQATGYSQLITLQSTGSTSLLTETAVDPNVTKQFHPSRLWRQSYTGEFRRVVAMFIVFQGAETYAQINQFVRHVLQTADQFESHFAEVSFSHDKGTILLYFGAPIAHENSIKRALDFILTLQNELAIDLISWRASLTVGMVYAGLIGIPMRGRYTALGTTVNLAARFVTQADWGEILVSEPIAQQSGFQFAKRGEFTCKGFDHPIPAYLLFSRSEQDVFFFDHIIGREAEQQQLYDFATPLLANNKGGIALIYGEAGVGKSHLTHSLKPLLGDNVQWFLGQTNPVMRKAFTPFRYWLRRYFGHTSYLSEVENKARFEQRWQALLSRLEGTTAVDSQLLTNLHRTKSFLAALIGLYWPNSLYEQLDAQLRYVNLITAIKSLLIAESSLQPVVFEMEDGHWMDESSQELLMALSTATAVHPILLLITSRYTDTGDQVPFNLSPDAPTLIVDLPPLALTSIRQQAESLLAGPIDAPLLNSLVEKTEGNPFFIQQLLLYFQDSQWLQRTETGTWHIQAPDDFQLPTSITAILIARIDRLERPIRALVQTAAVLGHEFDARILNEMMQQDVTVGIKSAEQEQIWHPLQKWRHYIFKHVLLRDAAYQMQLRSRLRELHHLAAQTYEKRYASQAELSDLYASLIATHYEQAGQTEAMAYWHYRAGQYAQANYANEDALAHYHRSLTTEMLDVSLQNSIYEGIGEILRRQMRYQEATVAYEKMLMLAQANDDKIGQAKAWMGLSWTYQTQGYDQKSLDSASEAEQLLRDLAEPPRNQLAEALYHKGWAYFRLNQPESAKELAREGLTLSQQADSPREVIRNLNLLSVVEYYVLGEYETAVVHQEEALAIARKTRDRHSEGFLANNLGDNYRLQGDNPRAVQFYSQAVDIAREIGDRDGELAYLSNLAGAEVASGEYATAVARLTNLITTIPQDWYALPDSYTFLSEAYLELGQLDLALTTAQKAWQVSESPDHQGAIWRLLGRIASEMATAVGTTPDDTQQHHPRDCFAHSLALAKTANRQRDEALCLSDWAHYELTQGDADKGEALQQEAYDLFLHLNLPLLAKQITKGAI